MLRSILSGLLAYVEGVLIYKFFPNQPWIIFSIPALDKALGYLFSMIYKLYK